MHVAASNPAPEFKTRADISAEVIATEKSIEMQKDDLQGKPDEIKEKIVEGRISKLLAVKTLDEQPFIKNPDQKVKDYLGGAIIDAFVLLKVGEGETILTDVVLMGFDVSSETDLISAE
jgi:elongation factor Ts